MYRYHIEYLNIPYKFFKAGVTEEQISLIDERIASCAAMGWELVIYTYMGGTNEIEKGLLMTFRKGEAGSGEMQHGRNKDL